MSKNIEVVLYGASGYTGKLVAWKLAKRGIPFIAAGRNKERLEEQMKAIPELRGAKYECVGVANERAALTELFTGKKVVLNIVGPFGQLGMPVVEACLEAGCHYFDTTGEMDWVMLLRDQFGKKFADRGLALCPANSYMWAEGNIAAEIALETPGIDTLDIVYLADTQVSVASTSSFLRMCTNPQYYLQGGSLAMWPYAKSYTASVPGQHRLLNALPWSGGGEPIWYQGDSRVRNCSVLVSFRNEEMFDTVRKLLERFETECRHLSQEEREKVANEWGAALTSVEPPREIEESSRCVLSCHARGNTRSLSVVIRGNGPYAQTGVFMAEAASRTLCGKLLNTGFVSPARAFGARNLLAAQAEEGYLTWEVTSA